MELFVKNRPVALSDHLNDPAFGYIINRYNEELGKLFKNVSRKYRLDIGELLYYLTFKTISPREILLIDKHNNKVLLRSVIVGKEYTTFIDSDIKRVDMLLNIHNYNIHFINTILYNKINKFITYIKLGNSLVRLFILSIIFLLANIADPLQLSNFIIARVVIYSSVFLIYPILRPMSSFIIRKLLYLITRVVIRYYQVFRYLVLFYLILKLVHQ